MTQLRFSASNAARLMACPGSADLEKAIPGFVHPVVDENKGAKGKGSRLHEMLELTSELAAKDLAALARALDYMAELRSRRRFKVLAEESVVATWLKSQPRTTVDVVLYTQDELHIVDYKTGTIFVDVNNNEQLMFYALCFAHLAPQAKGVWLHIVQPWADNCNSVFVTTTELAAFKLRAEQAEALVLAGSTKLGPSDHCKFCPANPHSRGDKGRPFCPAMMQLLYPPVVDEQALLDLDGGAQDGI